MDDILKEIEKSADDIQIPTSLDPNNVKKKLKERKLSEESNYMNYKKSEYKKVDEEKHKNKKFNVRKIVEYAAAIALVIGIGSAGIYNVITRQAGNESEKNIQSDEINASNQVASCEDADKNTRNDADQSQLDSADAYLEKKNDIGTYHLASNYEEVYKLVDTDNIYVSYCGKDKEGAASDGSMNESNTYVVEDKEDASATKKESYSQTNLQVDGVDESDYVKTDGSYIYVQKEDKIVITDVRNEKMNISGEIYPDLGENGHIRAMYVDGNQLFLVLQKNASDKMKCILQTYNIADRKNAKLEGSVVVEGEYADSRKVGDFVYLFTNKGILYNETTYKGDKEKIIPLVNDKKIPSGCIYVQNHANSEFIAVSVNVKKPTEIVDQMMVMNASVNVYMGTDAIYLYSTEYKKEKAYTNITKFQYNDGYMSGVASKTIKGEITDVFAISESNNILRVLTTEWDEQSKNRLYMLDDKMQILGKLSGIADGEEIYAARYIGNIAYFITYHNTDPLFAVDISDPETPKVIGELKITGFSDYLHPYGKDKILGIGYETDAVTGEQLGVKLTMFDISNPEKLKVIDTLHIDGDYCSAADDYKTALVDSEKNVIGFNVEQWGQMQKEENAQDGRNRYYVYSWKNNHFVKQFEKKVPEIKNDMYEICDDLYVDNYDIRGLYIGDTFYLNYPSNKSYKLESYNMLKNYDEMDHLQF